jgi:hypothetical protein
MAVPALPLQLRAAQPPIDGVRAGFLHPPDEARVMMRWWWFGPAVTNSGLRQELEAMKAGGIGGAEIQPVYPQELDATAAELRSHRFLSPEHLDAVRYAATTASELGLRLSVTLGSGWPFGGSTVPVTQAAGKLRVVAVAMPASGSLPLPSIRNGEQLLAAFVVPGTPDKYQPEQARRLSEVRAARLYVPADTSGPHVVVFFISSRTGQQVKRAAAGAEGFVLDHFSRAAIDGYLNSVAEPLVAAFGEHPPDTVFSDSLEVYDADWTPDLLEQFQSRRGYDLTPRLPELVAGTGADAADLRYDWGRTLAELVEQNYLTPINDWAQAHHTRFRSQTYGFPAVTLSSNRLADQPEGEGFQWHGFSFTRWASSASHLYDRPVTSVEAWTSLHSPAFRATPLDLKALADTYFLQGINQLVGHGWPYSPPSAGEPGTAFYAAGAFNQHNPWWIVMPDLMGYLQRISYLMRAGQPVTDVAILLPTADAQARFRPGNVSVTDELRTLLGGELIPRVLDAGYAFDFIDDEAIERQGIHYPLLILPAIQRLPLATYRRIEDYVRRGGIVVATNNAPSHAPGILESARDSATVQRISDQLFKPGNRRALLLADETQLGRSLQRMLKPDVQLAPSVPEIGFSHRRLADSDIYFIANTDSLPHVVSATFRNTRQAAQWWNPFTGEMDAAGHDRTLRVSLAPYESRVLVFTDHPAKAAAPVSRAGAAGQAIDLSHDWRVTFDKTALSAAMPALHSWTDDDATRFYSGTATYERNIEVPKRLLDAAAVRLDFGAGTPVERPTGRRFQSRAWLDSPVREAAVVYVNGKLAGSVWHPPYKLDLRPLLRVGANELKIVVANTAINELAGRTPPDYGLLNQRYGERFTPQGSATEPLPSGLLAPLQLVGE